MKTIEISLAGRTYEINQLPVKRSKEWRKKFAEPIEQLMGALQLTGKVLEAPTNNGKALGSLVGSLGSMLLSGVSTVLLGSMDTIMEMLCDYAPAVAADREFIEENAFDDELVAAFMEVLKLAYPFGSLLSFASNGQAQKRTKKN